MTQEEVEKVIPYATKPLEFCMESYRTQIDNGMYFLHEHPDGARSWKNERVKAILEQEGVMRIVGDIYTFGMSHQDEEGEGLVRKRTGFMPIQLKLPGSSTASVREGTGTYNCSMEGQRKQQYTQTGSAKQL